jgi:broad specificity phosphatase PhoE
MTVRTIYLARHGETEWNRDQRFQGRLDSPLTALGIDQARRMGAALALELGDRIDLTVVASPLGRALRTAQLISQGLGLDPAAIETDARLSEVDVGEWAGLTHEEIEAASPGSLDGSSRYDWMFRAPNGESYDAVAARIGAWLTGTAARPRLIVVAHGVTGRLLRGIYSGLAKEAALALEVPQDAIFRLNGGAIELIRCPGR